MRQARWQGIAQIGDPAMIRAFDVRSANDDVPSPVATDDRDPVATDDRGPVAAGVDDRDNVHTGDIVRTARPTDTSQSTQESSDRAQELGPRSSREPGNSPETSKSRNEHRHNVDATEPLPKGWQAIPTDHPYLQRDNMARVCTTILLF